MPIFTGNSDNKYSYLPFVIAIGLNHVLMKPTLTVSGFTGLIRNIKTGIFYEQFFRQPADY